MSLVTHMNESCRSPSRITRESGGERTRGRKMKEMHTQRVFFRGAFKRVFKFFSIFFSVILPSKKKLCDFLCVSESHKEMHTHSERNVHTLRQRVFFREIHTKRCTHTQTHTHTHFVFFFRSCFVEEKEKRCTHTQTHTHKKEE